MKVVTDDMWAGRSKRFPEETPSTREYYLLRSIFEEHFPSQSALDTVPKVCSRPTTPWSAFSHVLVCVIAVAEWLASKVPACSLIAVASILPYLCQVVGKTTKFHNVC